MKALVTGGAGFIGSHLCETLASIGWETIILDNLSSGTMRNVQNILQQQSNKVKFLKGDSIDSIHVEEALKDVEVVFHFAANPEVRLELNNPQTCFSQNVYATYILLEQLRNSPKTHTIVFASTSTVYGEPQTIPTPEDYAPLKPISLYGASKLASEALISAYAHTFNKKAIILRLANTVGHRSQHGVIHDFMQKLRKDPKKLEILGDGTQTKSYLDITDCINAVVTAYETAEHQVEIYNVGSSDQITVIEIARIVAEEMDIKNVEFHYTGGVNGGRGWKGDVKNMLLDITKLKARGWKPRYNSEQALRRTAKKLLT